MIPNQLHFVFGMMPDFGDKPFSLVHYLAIRSAVEVNRPDRAWLHHGHLPRGPWWDRAATLVEPVPVVAPTEVFGRPLRHHAHRTDVLRLETLIAHGGIYLDCDVLCVRPFAPLLGHGCVLGRQEDGSLCNGVILAEPDAPFLRTWLAGFVGFRSTGWGDAYWDEYACRHPAQLAERHPDLVHVEPVTSFHWPSFDEAGLRRLFEPSDLDCPAAYCHHLWESLSWDRHLRDLTPEAVRAGGSYFARQARRWL